MSNKWLYFEDDFGESPMSRAMRSGHMALVDFMLRQENAEELETVEQEPPLHRAAYWGVEDAVRRLLATGAQPQERDPHGETPLHKAVRWGHLESVQALIDHGADVNVPDPQGVTPLHWAVLNGRTDVTTLLLQKGAHVHERAPVMGDLAPLDIARLMGYDDLAGVLEDVAA